MTLRSVITLAVAAVSGLGALAVLVGKVIGWGMGTEDDR